MNDGHVRMSDLQPSFQKLNERPDYIEQHLVAMGAAIRALLRQAPRSPRDDYLADPGG